MQSYILFANQTLNNIYKDGAYVTIALNEILPFLDNHDKAMVTKLVYGVIEHHYEFTYMIKKLCPKSPRPSVRICLRLGMYMIKYMDNIPNYAAVNEIVELAKTVKKEQAGFVNATLKSYIKVQNDLPSGIDGLGISSNLPNWLVEEYIKEYGFDEAQKILMSKYKHTHVRINKNLYSNQQFEQLCTQKNLKYKKTQCGYLIFDPTSAIQNEINAGLVTLMALDSIKICQALIGNMAQSDVLDMCAAPGGKSIYIAESNANIKVYALDIHEHRVELIKSYAKRMKVENVCASVWDCTILRDEWVGKFDYVLLDAPCSGVGVINSNPDIVLNRTPEKIQELVALQKKLINIAAKYLKLGGRLVYSTCSNLKMENIQVVNDFLANNTDFELSSLNIDQNQSTYYTFVNDEQGNDGFFVSCLTKKK